MGMNSIGRFWVGWLILAASLVAAHAQSPATPDAKSQGAKAKPEAPPCTTCGTTATSPDYVIGSEDTLHVSVWKEPDLTATLPVRPDGKISLPLLNDVQAAGLTPMQLAGELTTKLKKFVSDPQVTVVVTQINSQKGCLLGEGLSTHACPLLAKHAVSDCDL